MGRLLGVVRSASEKNQEAGRKRQSYKVYKTRIFTRRPTLPMARPRPSPKKTHKRGNELVWAARPAGCPFVSTSGEREHSILLSSQPLRRAWWRQGTTFCWDLQSCLPTSDSDSRVRFYLPPHFTSRGKKKNTCVMKSDGFPGNLRRLRRVQHTD